ncbi:MAG: hypothetical protein RL708_1835 [Bacteroidota bacterium]|jgi:hypothetical protein
MNFKPITFLLLTFLISVSLFATDKKKVNSAVKKTTKVYSDSNIGALQNSNSINQSPVEIQIGDASAILPEPKGNDFFELLGRNINEPSVQKAILSIHGDYELANMDGNVFYIWRNAGLSFKFDNKNKLQQVQFLNGKEFLGSFSSVYSNPLPKGISFQQNRNQLEQLVGKPVETSNPSGDEKFFATYLIEANNYQLMATFNTNSSVEMNAGVTDFIFMKNTDKQPNTVNTEIHSINEHNVKEVVASINKENNSIFTESLRPTQLIGKNKDDADVRKYQEELGVSNVQMIDFEQSSQYLNKEAGVVLNFDNAKNVASVMFVNKNEFLGNDIKQYQGKLPEGINFSLNRTEVEERLGLPMQVSSNKESNFWEMYSINNGNDALYITYNTKNADVKNALIGDIRVERLK